jgi:hypothetical protein
LDGASSSPAFLTRSFRRVVGSCQSQSYSLNESFATMRQLIQIRFHRVSSESERRLTMRCSELLRLSRSLLSHPAAFAHPAAQAARQPPQSLSLGSLGVSLGCSELLIL